MIRAGGEAVAAAGTALRIDDGGLSAEAVGVFRHQGERAVGAGSDTTAAAGAVRGDQEVGIVLLHVPLKNPDDVRQTFRCC
jgi:hypothetical protein